MKNDIINNIQNPTFCSLILWRYICGYYENKGNHIPLPLLFVILPIALREDIAKEMISTQKAKGLLKFLEKFTNTANQNLKKNDFIASINNVSIQMKELTLESIRIGIATIYLLFKQQADVVSL